MTVWPTNKNTLLRSRKACQGVVLRSWIWPKSCQKVPSVEIFFRTFLLRFFWNSSGLSSPEFCFFPKKWRKERHFLEGLAGESIRTFRTRPLRIKKERLTTGRGLFLVQSIESRSSGHGPQNQHLQIPVEQCGKEPRVVDDIPSSPPAIE